MSTFKLYNYINYIIYNFYLFADFIDLEAILRAHATPNFETCSTYHFHLNLTFLRTLRYVGILLVSRNHSKLFYFLAIGHQILLLLTY